MFSVIEIVKCIILKYIIVQTHEIKDISFSETTTVTVTLKIAGKTELTVQKERGCVPLRDCIVNTDCLLADLCL